MNNEKWKKNQCSKGVMVNNIHNTLHTSVHRGFDYGKHAHIQAGYYQHSNKGKNVILPWPWLTSCCIHKLLVWLRGDTEGVNKYYRLHMHSNVFNILVKVCIYHVIFVNLNLVSQQKKTYSIDKILLTQLTAGYNL